MVIVKNGTKAGNSGQNMIINIIIKNGTKADNSKWIIRMPMIIKNGTKVDNLKRNVVLNRPDQKDQNIIIFFIKYIMKMDNASINVIKNIYSKMNILMNSASESIRTPSIQNQPTQSYTGYK